MKRYVLFKNHPLSDDWEILCLYSTGREGYRGRDYYVPHAVFQTHDGAQDYADIMNEKDEADG